MDRSVSQKMGVKGGARAHFANAPEAAFKTMELPNLNVSARLDGEFSYIHLFARSQTEMDDAFPKLKAHLAKTGMLWVSWPKGRKLDTDLTLPNVIRIGYSHGLVESTALSVDGTWSAIPQTRQSLQ
jgi:hypothetical protein